ncbi:hypothetical protein [Acinetobacter pittii]|uniref:hypothetical protein n=1 Tax=Acinetobacter pittii TaxID=48296 RepID=UPI0002D32009|nr:hypothetical protein [Acinetobacter pittii]MCM5533172.1 hypothetical protein [Acinetobacter pittii]MCQ9383127.1 hypothetical protein [Acinetobacter pittii]MCR3926057.1 hypothetical protein [Acinetobacter pittii]
MGILDGQLTEQDNELNQSNATKTKPYKPTLTVDLASSLVYGTEKGLMNTLSAGLRPFVGDEAADKGLANIDRQLKPAKQGQAGKLVSGIAEVVVPAAITAPVRWHNRSSSFSWIIYKSFRTY